MLGGQREVELHPRFFCDRAASEFRWRALVEEDSVMTDDKVSLSHGVRRVNAVFLEKQLDIWQTVDGYVAFTVNN